MFKVNNTGARTTSMVSLISTLLLTLGILVSLLLTLNIFHILHHVKNAEKRALYSKKGKKSKFNRLQFEVFFLSNISPPFPATPKYRPIKFVLCPYIRPGDINGILWYIYICIYIYACMIYMYDIYDIYIYVYVFISKHHQ